MRGERAREERGGIAGVERRVKNNPKIVEKGQ